MVEVSEAQWRFDRTYLPTFKLGLGFAWAPLWPAIVAIFVPMAIAWRSELRRRRRSRINHCPTCGYDLAGLPSSDAPTVINCPECGTRVERNSA